MMNFKVKLFDAEGNELEIENQVIGDILFESEQSFDFFIKAIRGCLPANFNYQVIPRSESNKNKLVSLRKYFTNQNSGKLLEN